MMQLAHHHRPTLDSDLRLRQRQRGYIMAMFGLLLVPMLLMVGFAVDVGSWYNRASDMQRAADAASLAGVVWLPNASKAEAEAINVAARNGFSAGNGITVEANPSAAAPDRRLKVTITDSNVGSFFFEHLGGSKIPITRTAFAEYVLPVPMGSPRNYFGTGRLLDAVGGMESETLFQSINAYCTNKVQGDRHQSRQFSGTSNNPCTGEMNQDYRPDGYELYIDVPANRTGSIEVRLYDARYNTDLVNNPGAHSSIGYCTGISGAGGWTSPGGSSSITIHGFAQYQTRNNTSQNWGSSQLLQENEVVTRQRNLIRYRHGNPTNCNQERGVDMCLSNCAHGERYTFSLARPDGTPLDDSDNPVIRSEPFDADTSFDNYTYLGSRRWNTFHTIGAGDPPGRYILRVKNSGSTTMPYRNHANQWGVVAHYPAGGANGLCDARLNASCPKVYGKEAISVFANTTQGVAEFFLAEIEPHHRGKTLVLELWDPGEGGSVIRIRRPSGSNANGTCCWANQSLSWRSYNSDGSLHNTGQTDVGSIDVTGDKFNGKLLVIHINLSGYDPPEDNNWWKILYEFNNPNRPNVTDRTTWSARVIGDPVHLIEEN